MGLLAFAVGAVLWVIHLAERLTVHPWAGKELAVKGVIPDVYTALSTWTWAMFLVFTVLAFVGTMAFGGAILASSLLPHWLGGHHLQRAGAGHPRGHARRFTDHASPDAPCVRHRLAAALIDAHWAGGWPCFAMPRRITAYSSVILPSAGDADTSHVGTGYNSETRHAVIHACLPAGSREGRRLCASQTAPALPFCSPPPPW